MYRLYRSLRRHLLLWLLGHTDEDHLAQAGWNMMALIHHDEARNRGLLPPDLDDMAKYTDTKFGRFPELTDKDVLPEQMPECPRCRRSDTVQTSDYPDEGTHYCTTCSWFGPKAEKQGVCP